MLLVAFGIGYIPFLRALPANTRLWFIISGVVYIGGAVVVETIFAWPGMGRLIIQAIYQRDYPVVLAAAFVSSVMVILGNLIADILYSVVDPRVRVEESEA